MTKQGEKQIVLHQNYWIFLKVLVVLTMIMSSSIAFGSKREISAFSKSLQSADPLERTAALKMIAKYGSLDDSLFEQVNGLLLQSARSLW